MTEERLNKLIGFLRMEHERYQEIYNLGERKREVIVKNDMDELEQIVRREGKLLNEVNLLEESRSELVGAMSLADIIKEVEQPYKDQLKEARRKLKELIESLTQLNRLNGELINDSLQLTNLTLNLLTNNSKQNTYGKKGTEDKKSQNLIINQKA